MPITRTPWIDDDGTGTVGSVINNAEKTIIYNQIDGLFISGTWTPVDLSGAGLVFTGVSGRYFKVEKLVVIMAVLTYPATASGAVAVFGGLPFACGPVAGGFYSGSIGTHSWFLGGGSTQVYLLNSTSGANRTNAQMTGAAINFSGVYLIA